MTLIATGDLKMRRAAAEREALRNAQAAEIGREAYRRLDAGGVFDDDPVGLLRVRARRQCREEARRRLAALER